MADLSNNILKQFASVVIEEKPTSNEQIVYGTVVEGGVQLDGSSVTTPISTTSDVLVGERVAVMVKNHQAVVLGNLTSPAARTNDVKNLESTVSEFGKVVADVVKTEQLNAQIARIDSLVAEDVTINGKLTANQAAIDDLEAYNVEVKGKLTANEASISNLETNKLSASDADIKYATIDNLTVTNQKVETLEGEFGGFETLTANYFAAVNASINSLETNKLSATDIEGKYANIDFSNITEATMKKFYADSGLINYVTANEITTSYLEGVTIKGDLIEAGTLAADKLILKGTDGLYYELNTNGETIGSSQTEYNSLNGSVITKKSITAEKITVTDLYAFGATISGFHLTNNTIYSGVKSSVDNTTRGLYFDNDGQMNLGDASNYLKYYKDSNGNYKLDISADSLSFKTSNINVGGVNILRGTNTMSGISSSATWSNGKWRKAGGGTGVRTVVGVEDAPNPNIKKGFSITSNGDDSAIAQDKVPIVNGQTYTMSCYAKGNTTLRMAIGSSEYQYKHLTVSDESKWIRYSFTFEASVVTNGTTNVYFANRGTNPLYICGLKLEVGNIATDWQAAPEDGANYMGFSDGALVIGDVSDSTMGNNVLIDTDSVDIRNGSIVYASYGAETIYLGKHSENTVIDLCSGSAQMYHYHDDVIDSRFVIDSMRQVYINGGERVYLHSNYDNVEEIGYATIWLQSHDTPYDGSAIPNGRILLETSNSYYANPASSPTTRNSASLDLDPSNYVRLSHGEGDGIRSYITLHSGRIEMESTNLKIDQSSMTVYGEIFIGYNGSAIRSYNTSGVSRTLLHLNGSNNTCLGYGGYNANEGGTFIYGNKIQFVTKNPSGNWKPYFSAGDEISGVWTGAGFITNSSKDVYFNIPLAKPIIGNPTIKITEVDGFQIRQDGNYLYGGSGSTYVHPSSISPTAQFDGNNIRVILKMANATSVTNNDSCGVTASIKITFS